MSVSREAFRMWEKYLTSWLYLRIGELEGRNRKADEEVIKFLKAHYEKHSRQEYEISSE